MSDQIYNTSYVRRRPVWPSAPVSALWSLFRSVAHALQGAQIKPIPKRITPRRSVRMTPPEQRRPQLTCPVNSQPVLVRPALQELFPNYTPQGLPEAPRPHPRISSTMLGWEDRHEEMLGKWQKALDTPFINPESFAVVIQNYFLDCRKDGHAFDRLLLSEAEKIFEQKARQAGTSQNAAAYARVTATFAQTRHACEQAQAPRANRCMSHALFAPQP